MITAFLYYLDAVFQRLEHDKTFRWGDYLVALLVAFILGGFMLSMFLGLAHLLHTYPLQSLG